MQAFGFLNDLLKSARVGSGEGGRVDDNEGRSSPKRHWPQKAVTAQAATAASNGELRSSSWIRSPSIVALTGGRGSCLDEDGAKLCTPFNTYRKRVLPLHSTLCAACQALRAVIRLRGVPPACLLKLEAAKAHKTNSSAGKRMCSGTRSTSQNRRNCLMVPVYRLRVELAHPPWIA